MSKKKNRCIDCIHYVLGYSQTTQVKPVRVCNHHEKRIYRGDYNGVVGRVYYYSAKATHTCEHFKSRNEECDYE